MQKIINTLITDHNQYVKSIHFWSEFKSLISMLVNEHPIMTIIVLIMTIIVLIMISITLFSKKSIKQKLFIVVLCILTCTLTLFLFSGLSYIGHKYLHDDSDNYIASNLDAVSTQNGFDIYRDDSLTAKEIMTVNTDTGKYTSKSLSGLQYAALNDELVNQFGVNTAIKIISNNKIYNKHNNLEMKFIYKEKYYRLITYTHDNTITVNVE